MMMDTFGKRGIIPPYALIRGGVADTVIDTIINENNNLLQITTMLMTAGQVSTTQVLHLTGSK